MSHSHLVKIRPIAASNIAQDKTIGYAIKHELLLKLLSSFELACINTKKLNLRAYNRKSGATSPAIDKNFWTPDYCFIGSVVDKSDTLSLKALMGMLSGESNRTKAAGYSSNFNKHFPKKDKSYTYHYRISELNSPAMMYIKGIKFVASIIYQYELYRQTNSIEELSMLDKFMRKSGMGCLLNPELAELMTDYRQFYSYQYVPERDDIVVKPNLAPVSDVELPIRSNSVQTILVSTGDDKKPENIVKASADSDATNSIPTAKSDDRHEVVDKFVTAKSIDVSTYEPATKESPENFQDSDLERSEIPPATDLKEELKEPLGEQLEVVSDLSEDAPKVDSENEADELATDSQEESEVEDEVVDISTEEDGNRPLGIHALLNGSAEQTKRTNEDEGVVARPPIAPPRTGLLDKFKSGGINLDNWDIETPDDNSNSGHIVEDTVDVGSLIKNAVKERNRSDD